MVFFLSGQIEDIIVLKDKNGEYTECISYGSLLGCSHIECAIIHERIFSKIICGRRRRFY